MLAILTSRDKRIIPIPVNLPDNCVEWNYPLPAIDKISSTPTGHCAECGAIHNVPTVLNSGVITFTKSNDIFHDNGMIGDYEDRVIFYAQLPTNPITQ